MKKRYSLFLFFLTFSGFTQSEFTVEPIPVAHLPAGVYSLFVEANDQMQNFKFVKNKEAIYKFTAVLN